MNMNVKNERLELERLERRAYAQGYNKGHEDARALALILALIAMVFEALVLVPATLALVRWWLLS